MIVGHLALCRCNSCNYAYLVGCNKWHNGVLRHNSLQCHVTWSYRFKWEIINVYQPVKKWISSLNFSSIIRGNCSKRPKYTYGKKLKFPRNHRCAFETPRLICTVNYESALHRCLSPESLSRNYPDKANAIMSDLIWRRRLTQPR